MPLITSTIRDIPTEAPLAKADGMRRDCAINLESVQTVSRRRIGLLITKLNTKRRFFLRSAPLFAFGFRQD